MIPRARIAPKREVDAVRPITREDLPRLLPKRDASSSMPTRLKDSHHTVARLIASGLELTQVAALAGYSLTRIQQLSTSPAMVELISHYRGQIDATWLESQDAYYDLATKNMLAAERHISDRIADLDAEDELLSVREALAISRDAADRFGYGKRQTNFNVNADFATLLEKAIQRSGKTIEGSVANTPTKPSPQAGTSGHRQASQPPLRRIA